MTRFELRPGIRRIFRLPIRTPATIHADVDEELEALIASRVDALVARGASPAVARADALLRLGASLDSVRADLHHSAERRERRMRLNDHLETLIQDVRYAARGLARRPGFTAVAVLTLAIGIGATTAIFSAVNVLLLRPLPFAKPDELMTVSLVTPDNGRGTSRDDMEWSYPKYVVLRGGQRSFSSLALYEGTQVTLTSEEPELIRGEDVGATYLRTLGLSPVRGRDFDVSEDATPGAPKQAILSYALWQRRYNLDPLVIGRAIDVDREPYTIVGVTPRDFRGLTGQAEMFIPIMTRAAGDLGEAWSHEFSLIGRRARSVTVDRATTDVAAIGRRVNELYPDRLVGAAHWG
ncbi:MAG TPA: ABC transporter permease, partial [Gemmatimonadaceae bacterium]|nr:ABC transporter permease [Gemmatimonadaceae bacterium]